MFIFKAQISITLGGRVISTPSAPPPPLPQHQAWSFFIHKSTVSSWFMVGCRLLSLLRKMKDVVAEQENWALEKKIDEQPSTDRRGWATFSNIQRIENLVKNQWWINRITFPYKSLVTQVSEPLNNLMALNFEITQGIENLDLDKDYVRTSGSLIFCIFPA